MAIEDFAGVHRRASCRGKKDNRAVRLNSFAKGKQMPDTAQQKNSKIDKNDPNRTTTISMEITEKLVRRIIKEEYPPGTRLPPERELASEFGITRLIVREALKRIEGMGLITIRHGSGAYVEDINVRGGIELIDLLLIREDSSLDPDILRAIFEFHEFTVVNAVKFASQRITPEELEHLKSLVERRSKLKDNEREQVNLTLEISRTIADASHNVYIHLLLNSVLRLAEGFRKLFELPAYVDLGIQSYYERIIEAFEQRDSEMAMVLTTRIFDIYEKNVFDNLEGITRDGFIEKAREAKRKRE